MTTAILPRHSLVVAVQRGLVYIARTDPSDGLVYLERRAIR